LKKADKYRASACGVIQPFNYKGEVTGDTISVSVSPEYSKITVNGDLILIYDDPEAE
jgi:hypothetical protein